MEAVITPITLTHMKALAEMYPGAFLSDIGNGTFLCTIPRFKLPDGWSKKETMVCFVVPAGYPCAQPAYFWTDGDLLLASGATPSQTDIRGWVGVPDGMRWWSYRPNGWSPNRDTLVTYAKFIMTRFFRQT